MLTPDGLSLPRSSPLRRDVAGRARHIRRTGPALLGAVTTFVLLAALVHLFGAPLPLVGTVALLGLVLLLAHPHLATELTIVLIYVNLPAILVNRHGVPGLAAGAFAGLLLIPLMQALFVRRERIRVDATLGWMLLLLAVMLASSMAAVDRGLAFEAMITYAMEGVILYWLVVNAIRTHHALRRVLRALVGVGALLAGLSLFQEVTRSYAQEFGGLAHRNYVEAEAAGEAREDRRRTWDRAQGPVNESNRFAQILIVLLPLAAYLHRRPSSPAARRRAAFAGALVLAGVILTLSRGAFLALLLLGGSLLALRWLRASRLAVALVGLVLVVPLVTPFYSGRVQSILGAASLFTGQAHEQQELDGAIRGRTTVMLAALHVFMDHPLLGVGPAQFSPHYVQDYASALDVRFREIRSPRRAHTLYLELAAETGVLGLGVFLVITLGLLLALWRERRRLRDRPELADLATATALSLLAYGVTAIFLHLSYQRYLWLLVGIAGATLHVVRGERRRIDAGVELSASGGRSNLDAAHR